MLWKTHPKTSHMRSPPSIPCSPEPRPAPHFLLTLISRARQLKVIRLPPGATDILIVRQVSGVLASQEVLWVNDLCFPDLV